jgi:hypothetical protein
MGLLDRLAPRKGEPDAPDTAIAAADGPVFATKALHKFLTCLTSRESPVLLVEDIFADIDRHIREGRIDSLPAFLTSRFSQATGAIDGILCWDIFDYLDRRAAQALAEPLARILRPEGALLGFFGTAQPPDMRYTKYVIIDDINLKHRPYPAARGRQSVLLNRDIIRLFSSLRVSDSFLLKNNIREILFRKPA